MSKINFKYMIRRIKKTIYYSNIFKDSEYYPYGLKPEGFLSTCFLFNLPIITSLVKLLRLIGWVVIDFKRKIKKGLEGGIHLYGIWCYVGLPGTGKTISCVKYLDEMRRKYGDKIYIITNFYYKGQDEHLNGWEMFIKQYDKTVIFAWDELQNEFNSRKWKDFPMKMVHELTQNRKGHGKQIVYTTQTFTAVDNNFRNLTDEVVDCRTYLNRLTKYRYYKRDIYIARTESTSIEKKIKLKPYKKQSFIQTDDIRNRYDSFQRLDYIQKLAEEMSNKDKAV